jgi:hypothetical protein
VAYSLALALLAGGIFLARRHSPSEVLTATAIDD